MKTLLSLIFAFTIAALQTAAPPENHVHTPMPSSWKLNLSASDFGDMPKPKSDVVTYAIAPDKTLRYTSTTVDANGHRYDVSWTGPQDGTMKAMAGLPGSRVSFTLEDDSEHSEWNGLYTDCTRTVSPDQKRLTLACLAKLRDGRRFQMSMVYDRTK